HRVAFGLSKSRLTNKRSQRIFDPAGEQKGSSPEWADHRGMAMTQSPCPGSNETGQGLLRQGDHAGVFWVEADMSAGTSSPVTRRQARDLSGKQCTTRSHSPTGT
ncbi:hypothetical protein, partial [uncultured Ruegeria sp.]|uniref:hypothetical protein n=1 Tax=uncultured Ruegeria sp. TaxID=259304 RepID=UPI002636F693